MSKNKNKKKKEKIIYYDDNSTISDMSNVKGAKKQESSKDYIPNQTTNSSFKDKWKTYWTTVSLMVKPMLIVLCIIGVLFLIFLAISKL